MRAADRVSSSSGCVFVRTFHCDSVARKILPCLYGNKRTPRLAHQRSTAGKLLQRRKRCPRRPTSELCFRVRLAGGWPAGRTAFASFRSNSVIPSEVAVATESRDLRLSNLPITRAVICQTRSALHAERTNSNRTMLFTARAQDMRRNLHSARAKNPKCHCVSLPASLI
jgi:hypothetical protein